ncbi:MAG: hypothetical protein AAGB48_08205 [Planctomycetota bacterium]
MKTVLRAIGILAVLHLLLIGSGAAWLLSSGRIDERRVAELRSIVVETVAARDAREATAAAQAAGEGDASDVSLVPLTAEQQIDRKLRSSEADRQTIQRMRREVDDLRRSLQIERRELDEAVQAFRTERDAFEAERDQILEVEGDAQFQAAVLTLLSMQPKPASSLLLETIAGQPDGLFLATSYLDALPPKRRAGIMEVIEKDDAALAADLLDRLRTRGVVASADGNGG